MNPACERAFVIMVGGETENSGSMKIYRKILLPFASMIATLGVVLTLFVLWSYTTFGDIRSGWFYLGGYHLIAEQSQIELGKVSAGESKPIKFRLKNLSRKEVFLLGIESDCSCLSTAELPILIPGGKTFDLEVFFQANRVETETEVLRWIIPNLSVDQPIQLMEFKATIVPNPMEN